MTSFILLLRCFWYTFLIFIRCKRFCAFLYLWNLFVKKIKKFKTDLICITTPAYSHWWLNTSKCPSVSSFAIVCSIFDPCSFNSTDISSWSKLFCFCIYRVHENSNGCRCCILGTIFQLSTWLLSLCYLFQDILLLWFWVSTASCFVNCPLWQPLPLP